jgi:hypothetical protein
MSEIQPGTEHHHDVERFGEAMLLDGLAKVVQRGYDLAGLHFDPRTENGKRVLASWGEAVIGRIPCHYWREVGIRAAALVPYAKFTFGQFNEAWQEMVKRGEADGYLQG